MSPKSSEHNENDQLLKRAWPQLSGIGRSLVPDQVWLYGKPDGPRFVLKRRGPDTPDLSAKLSFEFKVLGQLAKRDIPVLEPIPTRRGHQLVSADGSLFMLSPFVEHEGVTLGTNPGAFFSFGQQIARLHEALATITITPALNIRRNDLIREIVSEGGPRLQAHLQGTAALRFAPIYAALAPELRLIYSRLPAQLIHRDCHADNFLWRHGAVVAIIDWDQLSLGPALLDLAYFAVQLIKRELESGRELSPWLAAWEQLLAGYRAIIPLNPAQLDALPYLLLTIPLLFMAWGLEIGRPDYLPIELEIFFWLHQHLSPAPNTH